MRSVEEEKDPLEAQARPPVALEQSDSTRAHEVYQGDPADGQKERSLKPWHGLTSSSFSFFLLLLHPSPPAASSPEVVPSGGARLVSQAMNDTNLRGIQTKGSCATLAKASCERRQD